MRSVTVPAVMTLSHRGRPYSYCALNNAIGRASEAINLHRAVLFNSALTYNLQTTRNRATSSGRNGHPMEQSV